MLLKTWYLNVCTIGFIRPLLVTELEVVRQETPFPNKTPGASGAILTVYHHRIPKPKSNQSSRERSTTLPAARPTTIGDGDLGSCLTDELDCSAIKEFNSAFMHSRQARPSVEALN